MPDPHLPQVNTPQGCVTLDVDPQEFVPLLDRLLAEARGDIVRLPSAGISAVAATRASFIKLPEPRRDPHPDHHLWNNNGVWFAVFTIHPTPITKERVRQSLQTKCLETARLRRDQILARCAAQGILAPPRTGRRLQNPVRASVARLNGSEGCQSDVVQNSQTGGL